MCKLEDFGDFVTPACRRLNIIETALTNLVASVAEEKAALVARDDDNSSVALEELVLRAGVDKSVLKGHI